MNVNVHGCFNSSTWDPSSGRYFDDVAKGKIFNELSKFWCSGLSLLGGEPFSRLSDNREVILNLVKEVKSTFADKTIWAWSGYTFEELQGIPICREILKYVDVLIDGPFIEELKDQTLLWRGSSNQRVIHLK